MVLILRLFVTAFFIVIGSSLSAQNIVDRTITWNSQNSVELSVSKSLGEQTTIITRSKNDVELKRGETSLLFTVLNVDGDWSDPVTEGKLVYHVMYQNAEGIITLERNETDLSFIIDFTAAAKDAMKQKIIIDNFE